MTALDRLRKLSEQDGNSHEFSTLPCAYGLRTRFLRLVEGDRTWSDWVTGRDVSEANDEGLARRVLAEWALARMGVD